MIPRRGRLPARSTAAQESQYQAYSYPGPSLGLVSDQNLAVAQPGGAVMLENIFPTATGGIMRRGKVSYADLSADSGPVQAMFGYEVGSAPKLFAITDANVWDVSTGSPPSTVYAVTSGRFITAQYTNADGDVFVRGVNGADPAFVYNGTTFSTNPALTFPSGESLTSADLNYVMVHQNRFFFLQKNSLNAWYLPVGQIGGELVRLPLGGEFELGGTLMFAATWSVETGDGLGSMCAFFTDQGEVVVYAGSNPSSAADWGRIGVYFLGKPLGPTAFIRRGGDITVVTDVGFVSLTQALQKDAPSLAPTAMSAPIENDWAGYARLRPQRTWAAAVWTEGQMVAVALPTLVSQTPTWLVANARTGKWARFTGWDATCLQVFGGSLYFGAPDGKVYQAMVGGTDDGAPYASVYVTTFGQMGAPGAKSPVAARLVMRANAEVVERLAAHGDFQIALPDAPPPSALLSGNVWGVAKWGDAIWGAGADKKIIQKWRTVNGHAEAIAISHQIVSDSPVPLDVEFIRTDVTFTLGDMQS